MGIVEFLARFEKVKAGHAIGRWMARCPAHGDKRPSLAIRYEDDGRILLHCFSGCDPEAILGAVGMQFSDLFPEPLTREFIPKIAAPFSALDALNCLAQESGIIAIAASDIALGKTLSDHDAERVATASGRIAAALEAVHGG